MGKLRTLWKKDPGFVVSGGVHLLGLGFLVVSFSRPPVISDPTESVSAEMITTSQFDQIMQGEKTAKLMPTPQRRVDKVAELEDHKPAPPLAEARKDTPPPPAPEKANDDPGEDVKPPQPVAALPPPRPPDPSPIPTPPIPIPPGRPIEKAEQAKPVPAPPPKSEAEKEPPPPDAEALAPKPPPRPKVEKVAKAEPTPDVKPVPRPPVKEPPKEVKVEPPKRPDTPRKDTKPTLDQVAKLLDTMKPPKPVVKTRSGNETKEAASHSDFSPDKISALLDHEAPQRKASTGRNLTQLASLGAPTAHASTMSPSMMGQLDNWLIDHYRGCWHYFGLGAAQTYVPEVRVKMAQDGSLQGEPALLNPPADPNLRSLADSAIRAVHTCNPMAIPDRYKPYYEAWRTRTIRFDPKDLS